MRTLFSKEYLYWLEINAPLTHARLKYLRELQIFLHGRVYSLGFQYAGMSAFGRLAQDTVEMIRRTDEQIKEIYIIVIYPYINRAPRTNRVCTCK